MKRVCTWLCTAAMALSVVACGFIDTGEVGVRTTMGKVDPTEEGVGFYTSWLSSLDVYSVKEITVDLDNLTPKGADNLLLSDMDVTIRYEFAADKVADFQSKRQGQSARAGIGSPWLPGYVLVDNKAHAAITDETAKLESLTMHTKQQVLADAIKQNLQKRLNDENPDTFKITDVTIRNIKTDPAIEESIRDAIKAQKNLETATKNVEVVEKTAQANNKLTQSLTPAYLQHEYNQALLECAKNKDCTMIVGTNDKTLINVGK